MARRKRAATSRPPGRSSQGTRASTNNRANASATGDESVGHPVPPTPRRSDRIRRAAGTRGRRTNTGNQPAQNASLRRSSRIRQAAEARQRAANASNAANAANTGNASNADNGGNASSLSPQLPARPSDPTLRGILSAGPVLENLLDYMNEWDRRSLIYAMPSFRDALRHPWIRTRFRCQNIPDLAALKMQKPLSRRQLITTRDQSPRGPCTTPARAPPGPHVPAYLRREALVRIRNCQGHSLGYTAHPLHPHPHGQYFWVCEICACKAWERLSVLQAPRAVDLCLNCSRQRRLTHPNPDTDHCMCLWDQSADKVHLCTDCRDIKSLLDHNAIMQWVHALPMQPIHNLAASWVNDYIDEHQRRGESDCICGLSPRNKILSHVLVAPAWINTLDEVVRICTFCHKQRFITYNRGR